MLLLVFHFLCEAQVAVIYDVGAQPQLCIWSLGSVVQG